MIRSSRPPASLGLLLVMAGLLCGCPHDEQPFRVHLKLAPVEFNCADAAARTDFIWDERDVRLTILRREGSVNGAGVRNYSVVCDKLFVGGPSEYNIPLRDGTVALRVEVFNRKRNPAEGLLELSGYAENVDLSAPEAQVVLRPAASLGGVSCAPPLRKFRAFHSATLLPNGHVLIVGGLVGDPKGEGGVEAVNATEPTGLAASSSVEYYNPATESFRVLVPQGEPPLQPRAFHQAVLLDSPADAKGPYQVLLLGGVAPAAGRLAVWAKISRMNYPFLLNPDVAAVPAKPQLLTITPGAGAEGDPKITVSDFPVGQGPWPVLFPVAGLFDPAELTVGGGAGGHVGVFDKPEDPTLQTAKKDRGFKTPTPAYWMELKAGSAAKPAVQLARIRAGHALARLDKNRYLVWGGNMDGDATQVVEVVEHSSASVTTLAFSSPPELTAWHTLTPIGGGDDQSASPTSAVLWAGGYHLKDDEPGVLLRIAETGPRSKPLQWLQSTDPPVLRDVVGQPAEPVGGYHEATRLADGSVLLSGGTAIASSCSGVLCPSKLMAIFELKDQSGTSTVELQSTPAVPALKVPRFGHRVVRLLDNTLLITGGITTNDKTKEQEKFVFLTRNELYNPRRGKAAEDTPLFRAPDKDSTESGAVGQHPCLPTTRVAK